MRNTCRRLQAQADLASCTHPVQIWAAQPAIHYVVLHCKQVPHSDQRVEHQLCCCVTQRRQHWHAGSACGSCSRGAENCTANTEQIRASRQTSDLICKAS